MKKIKTLHIVSTLGIVAVITTAITVPLVLINKGTKTDSYLNQGKQTVVTHEEYSSLKNVTNSRTWDMSVQHRSKAVYGRLEALMPLLFKTRVTQEAEVKINARGETTLKKPRKTKMTFDGISAVTVNGNRYTNYGDFKKGLGTSSTTKMEFEVVPGIKWINSEGQKTKYNFKAIDFFYGWLRGLYASETARVSGNVMGKNPFQELSKSYMTKLKKDGEFYNKNGLVKTEYNNGNVYLFNLFNIDIQKTIKANTGKNEDKDKFKLIFNNKKAKIDVVLGVLANTNIFIAVSSEKIEEMRGKKVDVLTKPGQYIQLGEYGKRIAKEGSDKVDLSEQLMVSRYYLENYDLDPNSQGIVLKKNKYSYDKKFNSKKNTINKYQIKIFRNEDEQSYRAKRQKSFLTNNSESVLFDGVQSTTSLMNEIKEKGMFRWTNSDKKYLVKFLEFNPWYMLNGTSTLAKPALKLLFGVDTIEEAKTSANADDEYFLGRGRRFRALLNSSINLKEISNVLFFDSDEVKTAMTYHPKTPLTLNPNSSKSYYAYETTVNRLNTPIYSATDQEMAEHVKTNVGNNVAKKIQTIPNVRRKVIAGWLKLVEEANIVLGPSEKITIPLYDYFASDINQPKEVINAYDKIILELNKLTPDNLEFIKFEPKENQQVTSYERKKTGPLTRISLSPDYNSSASLIQQLIGSYYGYAIGAQVLKQILDPNLLNNKINANFNYDSKFDFGDIKAIIKNNNASGSKYDQLTFANAKAMTMDDWIKFRTSTFSKINESAKIKFFEQLDDVLTIYFKDIVAIDEALLVKWSKFAASFAFENKLTLTFKELASIVVPYFGISPIKKIYQSKWMHLTPGPGELGNDFQLVDSWVEIDIK